MKPGFLLFLALGAFAGSAHAATPSEQLKQLTAQLQNNPGDAALREQIIKLSKTVKPAVPENARRSLVRGNSAFADAKSPQEFDRAIGLYREASNIAPWWGDVYFNLGKALEQRQDYAGAVTALKLYLLAVPGAKDARATQDRVYALEEKADRIAKETSAKSERKRWTAEIVEWLRTNYGGRLQHSWYCGVPGRRNVSCTDAEASANNWGQVLSQSASSPDLRGDNIRFAYSTSGPDSDVVQIGLGFPAPSLKVCGVAADSGIESVSWSFCDKSITSNIRLKFSRATNGNRPWIEMVNSCQGDLCSRERYVLEN